MAPPISPSATKRLLAFAALLLCALCVVFPAPWHDALRGTAHALASPALHHLAKANSSLGGLLHRIRSLWHTTEEIARLKDENQALREELARLTNEMHSAAVRLRSFTAFEDFRQTLPAQPIRILSATVVAADTSPWRHSLVVDRGSADGVRIGTPAVWGTSIVGTVIALRPKAATVRLLSDPRAGITVRVARTGDVAVLRGTSGPDGLLELKWVHLHPVTIGDLIVTSGLDPLIPPGLVAGTVAQATHTKDHLFYSIRVRPLVALNRPTELLLVLYSLPDAEELLREHRP